MHFTIVTLSLFMALLSIILNRKRLYCYCSPNNEDYSYSYNVETNGFGIIAQHWENKRDGQVRGAYTFLQPDDKVRVVEYVVDGHKGFKASVKYRKPPGHAMGGHLQFPRQYRSPIWHARPVSVITPDLFNAKRTYPNFYI